MMSTQVPGQAQFDAAAEMVGGVPFVGGSMASAMTEKVEEVAQAFLDALIAVATDPGCIKAFLDPILSLDLDDALALCTKGLDGPALAEFFEEKCGAVVKETMTGVVEGALEACALTAAFPSAKEAYNAIAGKVLGCVEIKILRRGRAEPSRRPPRHRREACSMAWRCWFLTARPSQPGRVIAKK